MTKQRQEESPQVVRVTLTSAYIRVLQCLARAAGPMSRSKIAEVLNLRSAAFASRILGFEREEKRRAFEDPSNKTPGGGKPSLLTLEMVRMVVLDIDGRKEVGYVITHEGREVLRQYREYLASTHGIKS